MCLSEQRWPPELSTAAAFVLKALEGEIERLDKPNWEENEDFEGRECYSVALGWCVCYMFMFWFPLVLGILFRFVLFVVQIFVCFGK